MRALPFVTLIALLTGNVRADILYTDATPSNTTLASGTALNLVLTAPTIASPPEDYDANSGAAPANNHWRSRTGFGNGGAIFASASGASPFSNNAPGLRTEVSGLVPNQPYETFAFFWVAGNGVPGGNQEWDVQAGLASDALTSIRFNTAGATRLDTSAITFTSSVTITEADRRLFLFPLGTTNADASGRIFIFIDDFPGNDDRTWFDGVGTRSAVAPEPPTWTGLGTTSNWSDAANWTADTAPVSGNNVIFNGITQLDTINDLAVDTAISGILFPPDAGAFLLDGNRIAASGIINNQSGSNQTIDLDLLVSETIAINSLLGTVYLDGIISGAGSVEKSGGGSLEFFGENLHLGGTIINAGNVLVSGDQSGATGGWKIGPLTAVATTVVFDLESTVNVRADAAIEIGDNKDSLATSLAIQKLDSRGNVTNAGSLRIGLQGDLSLNDGLWQQSGNANLVGFSTWSNQLVVNAGAEFQYAAIAPFLITPGGTSNSRGRITLNGGTFSTSQPIASTAPAAVPPLITLRNAAIFRFNAPVEMNDPTMVWSFEGLDGATIDTQSHQVQLNAAIIGDGTLIKQGSGTLTLASPGTRTGDTRIEAGTLKLSAAGLSDDASVNLLDGAVLHLDFTGDDVISALTLGTSGSPLPPGTYSASSHPAFIAGSGTLTIPSAAPDSFAAWAADEGLTGNPEADFDSDGLPDALEFVFGTSPTVANASPFSAEISGGNWIITFPRDDASEVPDITLTVESDTTLGTWSQSHLVGPDTGSSSPGVAVAENADAPDTITVTLSTAGKTTGFARVKVAVAP
jgi:autotransporter-associated beta strand protein